MADRELVNYFIEETNKRFLIIDAKIDTLLAFKWQIIAGATALSGLLTIAIQVAVLIWSPK